jgi:hypothetical protein
MHRLHLVYFTSLANRDGVEKMGSRKIRQLDTAVFSSNRDEDSGKARQ